MRKRSKWLIVLIGVLCLNLTACELSFDGNGGKVASELTKLPTPVISSVENGYVYWEEVPNASSYVIKINNYQESAGNQLRYSISSIMDGRMEANEQTELHIYVKAKGNQIMYSDSEWSAEKTCIYTKPTSGDTETKVTVLKTPLFSYDDKNNVFEWQAVDGADGYELLVNGKSVVIPKTTKCDYRPDVTENVDFTFSMRALAPENSAEYADSEWTRSTTFKYSPVDAEKTTDVEALNKAQELRIGYAYNFVDDEYFDVTKSSVNSVINLNELFKNARLNVQPSTYTKSESIYKESIADFQTGVAVSLNSEVTAGGSFSIYSANVSAGLKSSTSIDFSKYGKSGFLNAYSYAEYKNYQVIEYGNTLDLSELLTDNFKAIVNREGYYSSMSNEEVAEFILNNFGTHLILGVKTGGRLDYYYSFATNNSKVSADFKREITANASGGIANIISASTNNSLSAELKASLSKGDTENSSSFVIYGGSTDGISSSNVNEKFVSWSSSIDETNARSIGVSRNGIIYLPTLISYLNPNLGNLLDTIIKSKADEQYKSLVSTFKNAETFIDTGVDPALEDLTVYDGTIRSGEFKVKGSGKTCDASFSLNQTVSALKNMGYTHIRLNVDYQLREQDNCYIYVNIYDENNKSIYFKQVEHGGNSVNYSYSTYTAEMEISLNDLPNGNFRIEFKAENALFKDFYVGTVTGKCYAVQK